VTPTDTPPGSATSWSPGGSSASSSPRSPSPPASPWTGATSPPSPSRTPSPPPVCTAPPTTMSAPPASPSRPWPRPAGAGSGWLLKARPIGGSTDSGAPAICSRRTTATKPAARRSTGRLNSRNPRLSSGCGAHGLMPSSAPTPASPAGCAPLDSACQRTSPTLTWMCPPPMVRWPGSIRTPRASVQPPSTWSPDNSCATSEACRSAPRRSPSTAAGSTVPPPPLSLRAPNPRQPPAPRRAASPPSRARYPSTEANQRT